MLKALLFCPVRGTQWQKRYFPNHPAYLLPFANKPTVEYALDFCFLSGIREVRIVSDEESAVLRAQFRNGEMLGLNITYASSSSSLSLKRVVQQNKSFCHDSGILILSGFFLPEYDKRNPRTLGIGDDEMKGCVYGDGDAAWYLIGRNKLNDLPSDWSGYRDDSPVGGVPVTDILDYYRQNMRLAGSDIEKYNLPGFSKGRNSMVGRDVRIPRSARVKPPVILGNGIQFGRRSFAGPNIIVGDNCMIDDGTTVRDSIILGNTYIGRNLEISGKICFGNRIIDPESGISVDNASESVVSAMTQDEYRECPVYQRFLAVLLLFLQTLPYAVLRPFLEFHATLADCLMAGGGKRTVALHGYVLPGESVAGRLFRRLTLEKYHLLPYAAAGKMRLVGNCLLEATERNGLFIRDLPGYAPGIFSYSEYLGHENEPIQMELDEQYYAHAMDCWFNAKILMGILRRNMKNAGRPMQERGVME